ncbi:zinc finger BED domain-containing protein RICESLEEPER 2-like protein [Tanacetum coccineum]
MASQSASDSATTGAGSKENQFPVLSRMAMDILSVQASSVASESSFSTSGRLLTGNGYPEKDEKQSQK